MVTAIDAALRLAKGFFHWLAGQQGFKKMLSNSDVKHFSNNRKDARARHPRAFPVYTCGLSWVSGDARMHGIGAPQQNHIRICNAASGAG